MFPVGNKLEDSKWWVIDWKSNSISGSDNSVVYQETITMKT